MVYADKMIDKVAGSRIGAAGAIKRLRLKQAVQSVRLRWRDARYYQIAVLSTLIGLAVFLFNLSLPLWHIAACLGGAQAAQFIGDRAVGRKYDPKSALITALSLTLLLRSGSLMLTLLAAFLAIGSKYLIRFQGKHIFNPANFGLVITAALFTGAWISPGQWGSAPLFAILLAAAGGIVTGKAGRWDISLAFLASYGALILGRALWLGDPLAIPLHQMQSGALLIFAFFMISDPKTTPNSAAGRLIYAALVAAAGFTIQFGFYNSAGIIMALILTAPLVPLIDRVLPGRLYSWPEKRPETQSKKQYGRGLVSAHNTASQISSTGVS